MGQPRTDAGTPLAAVLDAGPAAIRTSRRFRVTWVGRAARRALVTEPGWRVFSVFRRSFYCQPDVADRLAVWLRPRLEGRTGLVSRAHLGCAAGGEGAAVLHDALAALACGGTGSVTAATAAVGTLGHCSGWDALVGIAVVAEAWLANEAGGRERSTACR